MRPTNLNFRNPKERTPGAYLPKTTNTGARLLCLPSRQSFSFCKSKRFDKKTKRTRIGPGSYSVIPKRPGSGPVYKPMHRSNKSLNNCYLYVGNCVIYDDQSQKIEKTRHLGSAASRIISTNSSFIVRKKSKKRFKSDQIEKLLRKIAK